MPPCPSQALNKKGRADLSAFWVSRRRDSPRPHLLLRLVAPATSLSRASASSAATYRRPSCHAPSLNDPVGNLSSASPAVAFSRRLCFHGPRRRLLSQASRRRRLLG